VTDPPAAPWPGHAAAGSPDDLYATRPPWDLGRPQPAFADLARAGAITGRVLDAGCGTGEHTLMAAALGLDATGIDLAATALRAAEHKARERELKARFLRHDARRLDCLGETYGTVLDCGLYHIFAADDRAAYIRSLHSALDPGGRFLMLCISDAQPPGDWGRVHRSSLGEIMSAFTVGWRIDSIEPATIDITASPGGMRAWLAAVTRTAVTRT
jgi:SAM-dependent methyltransferase